MSSLGGSSSLSCPSLAADSGSPPPPEQVAAYAKAIESPNKRKRREQKKQKNAQDDVNGDSDTRPIPFMEALTPDNTDYYRMEADDETFTSLNIHDDRDIFGVCDGDNEDKDEAGEDVLFDRLQSSATSRRSRILHNSQPSTPENIQDRLQIILEEKMHRLPDESPEWFNIRVQIAEMKAGMCAKKLAVVQERDPSRKALTRQEMAAIESRVAEKEVLLASNMARDSQVALATKTSYVRKQNHWRAWCARKGYRRINPNKVQEEETDDRVEYAKYVLYLKEGLSEKYFDGDGDPSKAVIPFTARKSRPIHVAVNGEERKKKAKVVHEVYYDTPSIKTVEAYICGVVDLYLKQQTSEPDGLRGEPHPRAGPAVAKLINDFKYRIATDPRIEFKRYTTIDAAAGDETKKMRQLMRCGWAHRYGEHNSNKQRITGMKNRLIASWAHHMMMRGENIRYAQLPHINLHTFTNKGANLSSNQESDHPGTLAIVLIMTQGRTLKTGGVTYGIAVRHADVELCPLGTLAFYLFQLWQDSDRRPDFINENDDSWRQIYLVFHTDRLKKLPNIAHVGGMSMLFQRSGIETDNPTHYDRHSGANLAYALGQDIRAIEHRGGWKKDQECSTPISHYLHPLPKGVAYALAGSTRNGMPPIVKRSVLRPPVALQKKVFPFLEECFGGHPDWLALLENIMEDRDELFNRSTTKERIPNTTEINVVLRLKFLRMLAHLRKILLQDSAVLMETKPDNFMSYAHHEIFDDDVFKDPLFIYNTSSIHAEFRNLDTKMTNGFQDAKTELRTFTRTVKETTDSDLQRLGDSIATAVGSLVSEHLREISDVLASHTANYNLAISHALRRAVEASTMNSMADFLEELNLVSSTQESAPSVHPGIAQQRRGMQRRVQLEQHEQTTMEETMVDLTGVSQAEDEQGHEQDHEQDHELDHEQDHERDHEQEREQDDPEPDYEPDYEPDHEPDHEIDMMETEGLPRRQSTEQGVHSSTAPSPMPNPASPPSLAAPIDHNELLSRMDELALELGTTYNPLRGEYVSEEPVEMISNYCSIRDLWKEWFQGVRGRPSIWVLNGVRGRRVFALNGKSANTVWRWRANDRNFPLKPNSYDAQWKFKKDVVYQVLKVMLELDSSTPLAVREETALTAVEKAQGKMSLNAFIQKVKVTKKSLK
ncbi:hypothetical protein EMPS_00535 [Entomortierella parvispora]|uniref:Ndc10 domain-containing protein n=1 Tax=Entomortierella parvispora TaxID=205924 RepID=A0A9P3H148_9FUNG|nr:hypothetical protein EMPS_00535 [Entomortierella parvispora]